MKITVLAGQGKSSNILVNWLVDAGYTDLEVIFEAPPSRKLMLKQRARKLGWHIVAGQVLFLLGIAPVLRRIARGRLSRIMGEHQLRSTKPDAAICHYVGSINDPEVIKRLEKRNPDLVLVNGTRIIRAPVLEATTSPIINTHVGITPHYRGVHGGYWSLWNNDAKNFGVTLHLVDTGVDTGPVLYQARVRPDADDNFATYPLLQQAAAFSGLSRLLMELANGHALACLPSEQVSGTGRQWYHPTLLQYLSGRLRGVK